MKYVSHHLNKHHLLHAPHKWFLAALVSPIHALEVHYQKRYHLQFAHARKLFLFDILLLASIFVIGGAALFWHLYDPTVQSQVALAITVKQNTAEESGRVRSGERMLLHITYKNNSPAELIEPIMHINFPAGFLLANVQGGTYATSSQSISLADLKPKSQGEIIVAGQFFGEPDQEYPTGAELVYRQKNHTNFEVVTGSLIATLRGSTLTGTLSSIPATIFENSSFSSELTIKNNYSTDLENIAIAIRSNPAVSYKLGRISTGKIDGDNWYIPRLPASESVTLPLSVQTHVPKNMAAVDFELTPAIIINGITIKQEKIQARSTVVHPNVEISSVWSIPKAGPGDTADLTIRLKNSGTVELKNVSLSIPLPAAIVSSKTPAIKNVSIINTLAPGASTEFPLSVSIVNHPSGPTDLKLILNPKVTAVVPGTAQLFETKAELPPLLVGTNLIVNTDAHYYSLEGDQIGRGPLPPVVGKETKYWALLEIKNGTSAVSALKLTATLPPGINWTGKTSVSEGREPIYSSVNRTVTWEVSNFSAHESAHINFELAVTPTENNRGRILPLLTNIQASAWDMFIEKDIKGFGANLDTSLPSDPIAQEKGVLIR